MKWFSLVIAAGLLAALPLGAADKDEKMPGITFDKSKRTITIDCKVAPRKIDDPAYKEIYPIEVLACWPFRKEPPGGQKAHETVVTFDFATKPSMVHKLLEELGLKPGKPAKGGTAVGEGPEVKIYFQVPDATGKPKNVPVEKTMVGSINPKLKLPTLKWRFTGSIMRAPNPEKPDDKAYAADLSGTMMSIFAVTDETVFQSQLTFKDQDNLKLETNKTVLPEVGKPLKMVVEAPEAKK
jgi:hypothetical protein